MRRIATDVWTAGAAVICCGLTTLLAAGATVGVGAVLGRFVLAAAAVAAVLALGVGLARHGRGGRAAPALVLAGGGVGAAVLLGLYLLAGRAPQPAAPPPVPIAASGSAAPAGEVLPAFRLPAVGGGAVAAADLQGRPAVINFFASWCPSCWAEIPHLARAYADHRRQGLQVLGIGVLDSEESLRWMAGRLRIPYPAAYDEKGDVVVSILRLRSMPTTLFVDRQGVVRARWEGFLDEQTLRRLLAQIL